jgi:hypothetical protein
VNPTSKEEGPSAWPPLSGTWASVPQDTEPSPAAHGSTERGSSSNWRPPRAGSALRMGDQGPSRPGAGPAVSRPDVAHLGPVLQEPAVRRLVLPAHVAGVLPQQPHLGRRVARVPQCVPQLLSGARGGLHGLPSPREKGGSDTPQGSRAPPGGRERTPTRKPSQGPHGGSWMGCGGAMVVWGFGRGFVSLWTGWRLKDLVACRFGVSVGSVGTFWGASVIDWGYGVYRMHRGLWKWF